MEDGGWRKRTAPSHERARCAILYLLFSILFAQRLRRLRHDAGEDREHRDRQRTRFAAAVAPPGADPHLGPAGDGRRERDVKAGLARLALVDPAEDVGGRILADEGEHLRL